MAAGFRDIFSFVLHWWSSGPSQEPTPTICFHLYGQPQSFTLDMPQDFTVNVPQSFEIHSEC